MSQRMLTAEEYTQHLQQYCGLKDDEVKFILANVYKRMKLENKFGGKKYGKEKQESNKENCKKR